MNELDYIYVNKGCCETCGEQYYYAEDNWLDYPEICYDCRGESRLLF